MATIVERQTLEELTRSIKSSFAAGIIFYIDRQHLGELFNGDVFSAFVWLESVNATIYEHDDASVSLAPNL